MKKIAVLGAGRVGGAMAIDLSKDYMVRLADLNSLALNKIKKESSSIETAEVNFSDENAISEFINDADLVVSAVPGFMGYKTLQTILNNGKDVVDISFFPEDALTLNDFAQDKGITAIVDCGVAPGMDNILLGYWNEKMEVKEFECLVGGLPEEKKWPFQYKAPFSPIDVIEEYTRPARLVENGKVVTKEPLTENEIIDFSEIGPLEAFNSDGLRSLILTMGHIPNMKEKTLRYPGHSEYIRVLKESGFFSETPLDIKGQKVIPLEFSSKILISEWQLDENEPEFTIMRVTIKGLMNGKEKKVVYDLLDRYDPKTKTSSMARTTGYTATAAANLILRGMFSNPGINPPEIIGGHEEKTFQFILAYLKERNIEYRITES